MSWSLKAGCCQDRKAASKLEEYPVNPTVAGPLPLCESGSEGSSSALLDSRAPPSL